MINFCFNSGLRRRSGLSLLEVIVAVALFSLFATALVGLVVVSFGSDVQTRDKILAARYAEQGIEAARSIRRQAWNFLITGTYGVSDIGGSWALTTSTDLLDGVFSRAIIITDVCRDNNGTIVDCAVVGAVNDLYSKKIISRVTYAAVTGVANEIELTAHLTNWQSRDWSQTDWAAGGGQTFWLDPSRYDSASNVETSASGVVQLARQGQLWTAYFQSPISGQNILDISAVSPTDIWAAGGSGKIFHYNGTVWSQFVDTGSQSWNAIAMASSTDGWLGSSDGQIYRFNGAAWSLFASVGGTALYDIHIISPTDVWAVGASGKIFHYNGTTWSEIIDFGLISINELDVVSPTDVWAVGASGKIFHYNGTTWSQFVDTGSHNFNAITMLSTTDGWAVGSSGKIFHYNGTVWSQFVDTGSQSWNAIAMVSSTDGWLVGASGAIYHFTGTGWDSVSSPVSQNLNSIALTAENAGWIIGGSGTVLQLSGSGYATNGWLVSSALDTASVSAFNAISWNQSLTNCSNCLIKVQARTAPDAGGVPGTWTNWYGATGADSYFIAPSLQLLPLALNFKQWAQYRIELTGDGASTPIFNDLTINYTP